MEDYKKKYEEALAKCRETISDMFSKNEIALSNLEMMEKIFPELKESEDEKIRKDLIDFFETYYGQIYKRSAISWLEKQGEQKSTDEVEPEFEIKKGKWYVCDTHRYTDFIVGKAYFCPKNGMLKPNENEMARYVAKHCFHLWTFQDAKDGDVLCCENGWTCIFKSLNSDSFSSHCFMDCSKWFCELGGECHSLSEKLCGKIHPATKEQRDLLFTKMKEAGYEWDSDKKELKKIEQEYPLTPDEKIRKEIIDFFKARQFNCSERFVSWLEKQDKTGKGEQKPVKAKFKVGDTVIVKPMKYKDKIFVGKPNKIVNITDENYIFDDGKSYSISLQDGWELVEQKPLSINIDIDEMEEEWKRRTRFYGTSEVLAYRQGVKDGIEKIATGDCKWSEEDEKHYNTICFVLHNLGALPSDKILAEQWLNSIKERCISNKPQSQWKPTKEQINALKYWLTFCKNNLDYTSNGECRETYPHLKSLYENLIKL